MKMSKKDLGVMLFLTFSLVASILLADNNYNSSVRNDHSTNFISVPIPIGSYSGEKIASPCGIVTEEGILGSVDDPKVFDDPHHYLAQLIWFGGYGLLEYEVKNPLEAHQIKRLSLFFEACPGISRYSSDHTTDISIYINEKKIGSYTISDDFIGKRGRYTPKWWPATNIQYGRPIFVEIREDGTYIGEDYNPEWAKRKKADINFKKVSDVGINDLNLNQDSISIRIGVDETARHIGGMSIFGERFGNYPKMLTLGLEYEGEKIYQPSVIDIINNPERYENKLVIMAVHPGGWGCPSKNSTPLPEGFSRSAFMIYDDTGCLYGGGDVLVGKVLAPELHTINVPGKETIVIEGKVKLDNNKIPFIVPTKVLENQ